MLHEQIALALDIHVDTLRKHYQHELSVGANLRRLEVIESQYRAAMKKGSTAAARTYLANVPELEAPPAREGGEQPAAPAPQQPVAVGKKEQAKLDATTAAQGTEWDALLPKPGIPLQ